LVFIFLTTPTATVADLGTGSGAIAIALAHERPMWQITATDKSVNALAIAKENAKNLNIHSITWLESDWFSALNKQQFNLIVSNPPYIAPEDPHLVALGYEPRSALIAEKYGIADLETIIQAAPKHLLPQGYLVVEHGYQQAEIVQEMLLTAGFKGISTQLDLANHPRATWGQWC
jgi:release factor glutamine methyltransferase